MDEKCKIACAKVMNVRSKIEFVKMDTKDGWTTQSFEEKLLAFDQSFISVHSHLEVTLL